MLSKIEDNICYLLLKAGQAFRKGKMTSKEANSIFLQAARNNRPRCADFALQNGAHPDVRDSSGNAAVWDAMLAGRTDIVRLLVNNKKANLSWHQVDTEDSILRVALINKRFDIAKLLIQGGTNVNLPNKGNATALTLSASEGLTEIVELLLAAPGINPNTVNTADKTALDYARENAFLDIETLLLKAGALTAQQVKAGVVPAALPAPAPADLEPVTPEFNESAALQQDVLAPTPIFTKQPASPPPKP